MRRKVWKKLAVVMSAVMMISLFGACSSGQEEPEQTPAAENNQEDGEQPKEVAASNELQALYDSIPTDPEHVKLDTLPELKADGEYTIGCAMTNVSTGWFKGLYDNLKILLDEAGINVLLVECNDDANEQVNQVENFIAQNVDAIIINPANPQETVTSVLEDTCTAGIPVVAVDVPPEEGAAYLLSLIHI